MVRVHYFFTRFPLQVWCGLLQVNHLVNSESLVRTTNVV